MKDLIHHPDTCDETGDSAEGPYVSHCGVRWLTDPPLVRHAKNGDPKVTMVRLSKSLGSDERAASEHAALNPPKAMPIGAAIEALEEIATGTKKAKRKKIDKMEADSFVEVKAPDEPDDVMLPRITLHGHGWAGKSHACGRCATDLTDDAREQRRRDRLAAEAWADAVVIVETEIEKLDDAGATELEVRRMFDGGDHEDGKGDHEADILLVDGAREAFEKARSIEYPGTTAEAHVQQLVDEAILRAAERDARVAEEEAAAHARAQAELDAAAAGEPAESGAAGHGEPPVDSAPVGAVDGDAHASTEPPPADGTHATDAGDDKPPPTE